MLVSRPFHRCWTRRSEQRGDRAAPSSSDDPNVEANDFVFEILDEDASAQAALASKQVDLVLVVPADFADRLRAAAGSRLWR